MNPPDHPCLGRAPALDGIRGCAVLIVLGHNLGWGWLKGGFFGVDVFFALSGFLITTLLLEEFASRGDIALQEFFGRRVRRLYPALVVLVLFSVASAVVLHAPATPGRVVLVAGSVLGYFSNWIFPLDPQAWVGGMGHAWSLAVEVHFYLAWACLLAFVLRRRGLDLRTLGLIAATIAAASALWRAGGFWAGRSVHFLYTGTDARLDAIFLGVGAALFRWHHLTTSAASPWRDVARGWVWGLEACAVAALALLCTLFRQESSVPYLGGFAIAGGAAAVLILTTLLSGHSLLRRVVEHPVLGWFGVISYSLYLWQVPLGKLLPAARLAALGLPSVAAEVVRVALITAVAVASYYGIERRFLRRRV